MSSPRANNGPNAPSQRDKDDKTLNVQRDGTQTDPTKTKTPLDKNVPRISTKKIMPLVVSYFDKLYTSYFSNQDAQVILVKLFLEIIQTTADEILAAFRNIVFPEKEAKRPHVISVEAVKNALRCSLYDSFKAALGSALKSMKDLLKLLSGEVTSRVNSALSRSTVQDSRLVLEEKSHYKIPRKNLQAMVHQARVILCLVRDKMCTKCGLWDSPAHSEDACPLLEQNYTEERPSLCQSRLVSTLDTSEVASLTPSLTGVLESVQDILQQEVLKMDTFRKKECCSSLLMRQLLSLISEDTKDTASTIVSIIETEMSLIHLDKWQIIHTSDPPQDRTTFAFNTKKPWSKAARQKIKSFFVLCYAKATFYSLMCRLCCRRSTGGAVSTEELMKTASSLLKELLPEQPTDSQEAELCVYERLSQDITNGQHKQLSRQLINLITQNWPQNERSTVRSKVQAEIKSFIKNIQIWLKTQQFELVYDGMVQRSLRKIQRVVYKSFISNAPVMAQTQHLFSTKEVREVHVPTEASQDVPEARAQPVYVWERGHYRDLVYEVVSLVLMGQTGPDRKVLNIDLLQQLESKMAHIQMDIQVKPTIHHFENVAKRVYRDLCSNYHRKEWVARCAVQQTDYRAEIVDWIVKHLVSPRKKKRFSSFLQSVGTAFSLPLQRLPALTVQLRAPKSF